MPPLGRDFLPDLDEGALWLQVQMPTGLSLNKASDMASDLRRELLKFPEVSYVVTQTGRNDDGTDPWTIRTSRCRSGCTPYDTWPDGETKTEFVDKLAATLARDLPGYSIGISQPIIDIVNDMIGGAHSPLVIKVYGDDLPMLRRIGAEMVDVLLHDPRHLQRLDFPGAADSADQYHGGPREGGALWHQHRRHQNLIQTGVGQAPVVTGLRRRARL